MAIFGQSNIFLDRTAAGQLLGEMLILYQSDHPVVLALPRGGVPVAHEVAEILDAPLDVFVVRKLGAPGNPEFGIGGIAEGGVLFLDKKTILRMSISQKELLGIIKIEEAEVERRAFLYRAGKPLVDIANKFVILVDDGLATGVTAKAAIKALKIRKPKKLIFAAPVCAYDTAKRLGRQVNAIICVSMPYDLQAIGLYYKKFNQTTDEEVIRIMQKAE